MVYVSCGPNNTFAINDNSMIYAFGSNLNRRLGISFETYPDVRNFPVPQEIGIFDLPENEDDQVPEKPEKM